jgi:hypothetical protein
MAAFLNLSPGRQVGMGPGGITMVDIEAYCRLFHVARPARFVRYIRALDAEWLAFTAERVKAEG